MIESCFSGAGTGWWWPNPRLAPADPATGGDGVFPKNDRKEAAVRALRVDEVNSGA